jgi:ATP-dependent Zn protease
MTRTRKRSPKQLRQTAIHEAGHAVIGRVLKQICGRATIKPDWDEGTAGHHIVADPYVTLEHWWKIERYRGHDEYGSIMLGRIVTFMAGREAEEEILNSHGCGDSDDQRQNNLMLDSTMPHDMDMDTFRRHYTRLRRHTRGLVKRHRKTIERVAVLLLERETLTRQEIARAIPKRKRIPVPRSCLVIDHQFHGDQHTKPEQEGQ